MNSRKFRSDATIGSFKVVTFVQHYIIHVIIITSMDFTALHGMQTRLAMRIMSLCPSVKRVNCDKTEERSVQIFIPYERSFSLLF